MCHKVGKHGYTVAIALLLHYCATAVPTTAVNFNFSATRS